MEAAWGAARRTRVEQAFTGSGSPVAADTLQRVVPVLDAYATQWRAAHVESCKATHVARTQSLEMLDKRSVCLDRRLAALSSLTEALATADKAFVARAVTMPSGLPSIADCESNDALLGQQPLPTDPKLRAQIAALEARLDEQDGLLMTGDPVKVVDEARRLAVEVKAIPYLPMQARAQYLLVKALSTVRADLETEVRELAALAARAKDDQIAAYAWGRLIQELVQKGRMDEAKQLIPVAEAALERVDHAPQIAFSLYMTLGGHAGNTGDLEGATRYFEKALKIADDSGRKELRAGALRNLAYSLYVRGQRDRAKELIAESVALSAEMVGTNHPRYADVLDYQGSILAGGEAEDRDRAIAAVAESLRIRVATYGEEHPAVAENLATLALLAFNRDRFDEAEGYIDRALAILEKIPAPLTLPGALTTKADVVFAKRDVAAARPYYERALAAAAEAAGEKSIDYTNIEMVYAERLIDEGDCRRGRELASHSLKLLKDSGSPTRAGALLQLARCDRMEGKHGAAIARLEEHIEFCAEAGCEPMGTAIGIRELGRALVETGRDRTRGYQLVYEALDRFRKLDATRTIEGSEAWLKAHPQ
jgi:tetratricopeptide (TPR) repeat protein